MTFIQKALGSKQAKRIPFYGVPGVLEASKSSGKIVSVPVFVFILLLISLLHNVSQLPQEYLAHPPNGAMTVGLNYKEFKMSPSSSSQIHALLVFPL